MGFLCSLDLKPTMRLLFFFILANVSTAHVLAQNPIPVQTSGGYYGFQRVIVKLDPISRIPLSDVPFDRDFIIRMYFNSSATLPENIIFQSDRNSFQPNFYKITQADYDKEDKILAYFGKAIDIIMPPIKPNASYVFFAFTRQEDSRLQEYLDVFFFIYQNRLSEARGAHAIIRARAAPSAPSFDELADYYQEQDLATIYHRHKGDPAAARGGLLKKMSDASYVDRPIGRVMLFEDIVTLASLSTLQSKIETSAKLNIVADGGIVYTGFQDNFGTLISYVGINYTPRPMDSELPFSYLVRRGLVKLHQRISFNLGVTLNSIAKTSYRGNLIGNNNILIGIGFKFTHAVSVSGGTLFYNNIEPNPLLERKSLGVAPYAGLSINLKIQAALGELGKVFTYGK